VTILGQRNGLDAAEIIAALLSVPGEIRITHAATGWQVDPKTGVVYGSARRWKGRPLGRVGTNGYLVASSVERGWLLHRVVWEACIGPIPDGLVINHKNAVRTDNRLVNLEACTQSQNVRHAFDLARRARRAGAAGRRGEAHPMAKLTAGRVREIRDRYATGESQVALAAEFGVSQSTIWRAIHGQEWATT
jgi:hypothetical protein